MPIDEHKMNASLYLDGMHNNEIRKRYLLNTYRVLLTRARQGMVIFIPEGDPSDRTRQPEFYDPLYQYFIQCGLLCI